jgi:hypothetical protein
MIKWEAWMKANSPTFLITTGPLFNEKTNIIENWVQGHKYEVKEEAWTNVCWAPITWF